MPDLPPRRSMTYGEINSPRYWNMERIEADLVAEKNITRRPATFRGWPVKHVLEAVERVESCQWDQLSGGRTNPVVRIRESMVGSMRELSNGSFPEISEVMRCRTHSASHAAYGRFLKRPAPERQAYIDRVRYELERLIL